MLLVIILYGKGSSPCLTNAGSHHMETEQSPTRPYTAKFTYAAFAVASLSPPHGKKLIGGHFSIYFLKENISPVLAIN